MSHTSGIHTQQPMLPLIRQFATANQRPIEDITGPRRTHELAMLRRQLITNLYLDGYSVAAIARRLNRDHTTVLYHLGRSGKSRDVPRVERAQP